MYNRLWLQNRHHTFVRRIVTHAQQCQQRYLEKGAADGPLNPTTRKYTARAILPVAVSRERCSRLASKTLHNSCSVLQTQRLLAIVPGLCLWQVDSSVSIGLQCDSVCACGGGAPRARQLNTDHAAQRELQTPLT